MSATKPAETNQATPPAAGEKKSNFQNLPFLFDKQNYILLGAGLALIIIGFMLMAGGRSADPNVFDADAMYSFTRITLAPLLVLAGLGVEGYAIMRKPKH
ncbi:MAG TPA: DUF3098 domain-containing protein [Chitinophagaceae bacterium]|nr:DUF3098 domain-containing protein [Chitinophagaceae bacterium]HNF71233.1 DUF3098 domain-containing protein [Chitinophagaceae bacterium]